MALPCRDLVALDAVLLGVKGTHMKRGRLSGDAFPACVANYRMRPAVAPEYQAAARPNQWPVKWLADHCQRLKVLSTG
jgi:hypothetical protein